MVRASIHQPVFSKKVMRFLSLASVGITAVFVIAVQSPFMSGSLAGFPMRR